MDTAPQPKVNNQPQPQQKQQQRPATMEELVKSREIDIGMLGRDLGGLADTINRITVVSNLIIKNLRTQIEELKKNNIKKEVKK